MSNYNDLLVSASDAQALASLVGNSRGIYRLEADAADSLEDVLMDARRVPDDRLPANRVAMNSRVEYREEPKGEHRRIVLVHPGEADPSNGRISVLSPVGRALRGTKPGAVASISVPGGRRLTIRVLDVERPSRVEKEKA
jgi:regulator of nucleoside diphosphate kinase